MPRPCSICQHAERRSIDRAILDGESYRNMATRYDTSTGALQRHKPHVARAVQKAKVKREDAAGLSLLQKIERLESRVETLYADAIQLLATARKAGETKTAIHAVTAVRNAIAEGRQLIELLAEMKGEIDRRPQVSLQVLAPMLIASFDAIQDPDARQAAKVAVARRLRELDGDA